MPLVHVPGPERAVSERQRKARKIKPQYAEGELVKIARAESQAEAELIEGILLAEGIPSLLRRSRGFDVPDFLAAGPRDVLVPESGAQAAREALVPEQPGKTRTGWSASLVIERISSEARSNSASERTGVPSNGSSRCSSTQACAPVYSSRTFTVTGRGMR